jgi:uncharacterized protein
MTMTLSTLIIPAFINQLQAMGSQLEKGVAHTGDDGTALLAARLAPDMLPLSSQIKIACAQSVDAVARLLGQPVSVTPEVESLADAKALIADTIAGLRAADTTAIDAAADKALALDLPNGMAFDLSGADYVRDWALPQFHFHTSMAYAILRQQGVAIGKADLLPHMMAHARKPG